MKETREWAEKLRREAEECRLISKLATNLEKHETFTRLAETIDRQAEELEALLASGNLPEAK
jgi:hypothetical protein